MELVCQKYNFYSSILLLNVFWLLVSSHPRLIHSTDFKLCCTVLIVDRLTAYALTSIIMTTVVAQAALLS